MPDYRQLTAEQIVRKIKAKESSSVEITKQALQFAHSVGKEHNAFISICDDKALHQAEQIDQKIQSGEHTGILAGVPIALKDNLCYRDYPTTCASKMLENFITPYDATVVKKLLDEDAVIIGKTNMDEFAMGSSNEKSYYGKVINPAGKDLVPGGSSGGSAAAVSGGIVPLSLGSDTGGSIRQPAAFCDIFGLKPTYGAVSRYGLVAYGSSLDQIGPMARNLDDLTLLYQVIAGKDPLDTTSRNIKHPDYLKEKSKKKKFTIGIPKEYFTEGLDPEVHKVIEDAIDNLKRQGHTFIDVSIPISHKAIAMYYIVVSAESSSNLARFDGVKFGHRKEGDKKLADMYAETRTEGFGEEVKRKIMLGTYILSAGYYDEYYQKANEVRMLMRKEFDQVFEIVDLIISPTSPTPPFKFGEKIHDPLVMYLSDIYTVSANLTGIPGISIPFGKTKDGLPVGVQFMANHFDELSLFQIAECLK